MNEIDDNTAERLVKFCLTASIYALTQRATIIRQEAARLNERADYIDAFIKHRPDLKAEEPAEPEKPKRKPKAASAELFDELRDTKNKVALFLGKASAEMLVKFNAGLQLNHGLTTATIGHWSLTDAQNAWAVIRGLLWVPTFRLQGAARWAWRHAWVGPGACSHDSQRTNGVAGRR